MASVETSSSRPFHIVIFGASGFTGQYVVEEVARTVSEGPNGTLRWAVAGRSKSKLEKVLEQAAGALGAYFLLVVNLLRHCPVSVVYAIVVMSLSSFSK